MVLITSGTEGEGLGDLSVRRGKAWEIFRYGGGRPGRSFGTEGEGLGDLVMSDRQKVDAQECNHKDVPSKQLESNVWPAVSSIIILVLIHTSREGV